MRLTDIENSLKYKAIRQLTTSYLPFLYGNHERLDGSKEN